MADHDISFGYQPGQEIGYDQITGSVSILSTSSASPTTIITCAAHAFDGAPVIVEFFADFIGLPNSATATANGVGIELVESGTVLNELAFIRTGQASPPAQPFMSVLARWRFTPTAGMHTYVLGAYCGSTSGTPTVGAGAGTGGADVPAFVRFTKV